MRTSRSSRAITKIGGLPPDITPPSLGDERMKTPSDGHVPYCERLRRRRPEREGTNRPAAEDY